MMTPAALTKEFYRVRELAEILEVRPACVYRIVRRGEIPVHRIGAGRGCLRFRKEDVEAFLATRRVLGKGERGGESNN